MSVKNDFERNLEYTKQGAEKAVLAAAILTLSDTLRNFELEPVPDVHLLLQRFVADVGDIAVALQKLSDISEGNIS